jgi:hypothetical protein
MHSGVYHSLIIRMGLKSKEQIIFVAIWIFNTSGFFGGSAPPKTDADEFSEKIPYRKYQEISTHIDNHASLSFGYYIKKP